MLLFVVTNKYYSHTTPPNYSKLLDTHTEMLTQTLIKLDAIESPEERAKRKEQIQRVLALQVFELG